MRQKKFLRDAAIAVCAVLGIEVLNSCAGAGPLESVNFWTEIKELIFSVSAEDSKGASTGTVEQHSTVEWEEGQVTPYSPSAYISVELEKKHIDITSASELAVALTGEETVSETPYEKGNVFGKDIVKKFTYSDGQVATVSYGWRFEKAAMGGTQITTPHVEINPVVYVDYTSTNTSGDDHKVVLRFKATCSSKAADRAETQELLLQPWYTKTLKITPSDEVGEPFWTSDMRWDGWNVICRVTKTIPHTLLDDEVTTWEQTYKIVSGELKDSFRYLDNLNCVYEDKHEVTGNVSRTDGVWTREGEWTDHTYSAYFESPKVHRTECLSVCDLVIVFNNGEKEFTFETNVEVKATTQAIEQHPERESKYPNEKYIGCYVLRLQGITPDGHVVFETESYTDLLQQ